MTGDIYIFKQVIFLTLSSAKLMVIFVTLAQWKLTLLVYFTESVQVTIILLSLGKKLGRKK